MQIVCLAFKDALIALWIKAGFNAKKLVFSRDTILNGFCSSDIFRLVKLFDAHTVLHQC